MDRRVDGLLAVLMMGLGIVAAVLLSGRDVRPYDADVARFFVDQRAPTLNTVMSAITFCGSAWALAPLTLVTAAVLTLRRHGGAALLLLSAMTTSWALTNLLKSTVGRSRPDVDDLIGAVSFTGAFPSGHTLNSAVFIGVSVGIVCARVEARTAQIATIVVALVAGVAIGVSRLYLGYHWLSDVLGGWAVACAILGAAWLFVIVWARLRRHPVA